MAIKIHNESGFTLIEVMVSLAILGMVLSGVVLMFTSTSKNHTGQEMMIQVTQDIRATKNLMVDEIRSVGCNPDKKERMGFEKDSSDDRFDTDADSIHFTRDIDNADNDEFYEPDGDADDLSEDVAYHRGTTEASADLLASGVNTVGTLYRTTFSPTNATNTVAVVDNITDLQFLYYDSDNLVIDPATLTSDTKLDEIRSVDITITGQVQNPNRVSAGNRTWTQQFRILIRNL